MREFLSQFKECRQLGNTITGSIFLALFFTLFQMDT